MKRWLLTFGVALAAAPATAQNQHGLPELINAYRAAPHNCQGRSAGPVAPLAVHPALSNVQIGPGTLLAPAIESAGYPVAQAEAIHVDGSPDARAVMAIIEQRYCKTLLSTQFSAIGAKRSGNSWQLVFAGPVPPSPALRLSAPRIAGLAILDAVNRARAGARDCGEQHFSAAPPLAWNDALGAAALTHSGDMASRRYFSHEDKDGRGVGERSLEAGYRWRRIGENIAAGQESPDEVVAGWVASPAHCTNLMDPQFTEMGAGYAVNTARVTARVYWTQVFGTPP